MTSTLKPIIGPPGAPYAKRKRGGAVTELPASLQGPGSVWGLKELNAIAQNDWVFVREVEPVFLDWKPGEVVLVRRVVVECLRCQQHTMTAARLYHKLKPCICRGGKNDNAPKIA